MTELNRTGERTEQIDTTKIFFTDLHGRIMSLPINPQNIESIVENGIGFDGSSIAGYGTVENSDRVLKPIADSYRKLTFDSERVGFFVGNIFNQAGRRSQADPRAILEKVIAQAKNEFGFQFIIGPEHEFFLLQHDRFGEDSHTDKGIYFQAAPHDKGEALRNRIVNILDACGIKFEKTHHEVTRSQHEINLECTHPLDGADRTVLFNYVTQKTASDIGWHATFMPKPFDGYNRSAYHLHLSMQDADGHNVFYDKNADRHISDTARQFIAGILKHARETSIIMASTFNSYKAYVIEREAPIVRNWGFSNRSSMVRIPFAMNPESTRIELRSPDPAGNPYLQFAILIAMGLEGIRNRMECVPPISNSTYNKKWNTKLWDRRFLPKSMYEALVEAERSRFLKETLGDRLYDSYMTLKTNEWDKFRTSVTEQEYSQYVLR